MRYRYRRKPTDFRLLRGISDDHNIKRLRWHVARLRRSMKNDRFIQIIRLKRTRERREARSRAVPC